MRRSWRNAAVWLVCLVLPQAIPAQHPSPAVRGVIKSFDLHSPPEQRLTLPSWLREVSGLAAAEDGRDRVSVPMSAVSARTGTRTFHPSSVEIDPLSGHIVVLAGPERALLELTKDGTVVDGVRLTRRHRQPEGLTFIGDSLMLIADEGGKQHATLSTYRRAR